MRGTCSMHLVRQEMLTKFWPDNLKGEDHSEDLSVDGKISK
jgi:hypothetical protein